MHKDINVNVSGPVQPASTYKTKILKGNHSFASQVTEPNVKYVIKHDFVLDGNVTVPANCVLEFDGGSISNGTLIGAKTFIEADNIAIFSPDIILEGTWRNTCLFAEWFGAVGDGVVDDTDAIQSAVTNAEYRHSRIGCVYLLNNHAYLITSPINIGSFTYFGGNYSYTDNGNAYPTLKTHSCNAIELYNNGGGGNMIYKMAIACLNITSTEPSEFNGIVFTDSNAGVTYFQNCTFSNLFIDSFRRGINFSCYSWVKDITFNNVCAGINHGNHRTVECGIYISAPTAYGITFDSCRFEDTRIMGIYVYSTSAMTTPIIVRRCVFEGCGYNFDIQKYKAFGCFGIYVKSQNGNETGRLSISDSYFERSGPVREYNSSYIKDEIEADSNVDGVPKYTYVSNPNLDKTAEIVIEGVELDISNCHMTALYQYVSVLNRGKVQFTNNTLRHGWTFASGLSDMLQNYIVRIKDDTNKCQDISVNIRQDIMSSQSFRNNGIENIKAAIGLAEGTLATKLNANINIPVIKNIYSYWYNDFATYKYKRENPITIYIDENYTGTVSLGSPFAPYKSFYDALNATPKTIDTFGKKKYVFILNSDISIGAIAYTLPSGIDICFQSGEGEKRTITFTGANNMFAYCSNVSFINVNIVYDKSGSTKRSIYSVDSSLLFDSCKITLKHDGYLIGTYSRSKVAIFNTTFVADNGGTEIKINSDTSPDTVVSMSDITATGLTLTYYSAPSNLICASSSRPTDHLPKGLRVFDTTLGKPIYWNGTAWVDATGTPV